MARDELLRDVQLRCLTFVRAIFVLPLPRGVVTQHQTRRFDTFTINNNVQMISRIHRGQQFYSVTRLIIPFPVAESRQNREK